MRHYKLKFSGISQQEAIAQQKIQQDRTAPRNPRELTNILSNQTNASNKIERSTSLSTQRSKQQSQNRKLRTSASLTGGKKSKSHLPYEKRTVEQLQSLAKSRKIKCTSSLKKADLIKLIRKS